jgi:hypothetical protein
MNNGPYGKFMENKRHRILMEIVNEIKRLMRLISQPDFKDPTIYNESVVAVHRKQSEIYMDKPIYVGQAILDISKTIMYDFYYGAISFQIKVGKLVCRRFKKYFYAVDHYGGSLHLHHIKKILPCALAGKF